MRLIKITLFGVLFILTRFNGLVDAQETLQTPTPFNTTLFEKFYLTVDVTKDQKN